jgi:hypothetical protein
MEIEGYINFLSSLISKMRVGGEIDFFIYDYHGKDHCLPCKPKRNRKIKKIP